MLKKHTGASKDIQKRQKVLSIGSQKYGGKREMFKWTATKQYLMVAGSQKKSKRIQKMKDWFPNLKLQGLPDICGA